MIKAKLCVQNKLGLHARPSAQLTQLASQFKSSLWLTKGDKRVNAKSILGVMLLCATHGTVLELEADGEDEQLLLSAMTASFENRFGERE